MKMTAEQKAEELLRSYDCIVLGHDVYFEMKYAINAIVEYSKKQQAEIDRLQSKLTEFAGIILDYESKWDVIAENEGKRMLEFGEVVKRECTAITKLHTVAIRARWGISAIDIKKLFNNFKKDGKNNI